MNMPKLQGGEIQTLTEIQAKVLEPGISGKDILAKSNTGSGKTLAFLLVAIERIITHKGPNPETSFPIVILTPVTDLANQIANVAKRLCKYHKMEADMVIGGTDEKKDINRLKKNRIDVLVATPGRFKSILQQSPEIMNRLSQCQTFIIDEADKMTDPGFLGQTKYIFKSAQNPKMQTLMFSATMDKKTLTSLGLLKRNAVFVDAASGAKPQVNKKVRQVAVVSNIANHLDALVHVAKEQMDILPKMQKGGENVIFNVKDAKLSEPSKRALREWDIKSLSGYRIMVFLPSNAYIDYFAEAFKQEMPKVKTLILHGGMAQKKRTETSEAFHVTDNCILFTSDASARGVDYPDVTCVVQLGFDSRNEYLQRVGRTGRAGKSGTSYLITAPEENHGVELVCDVLNEIHLDNNVNKPKCGDSVQQKVYRPSGVKFPKPTQEAKKALRGWLGSLASKWKRLKMTPSSVVNMAQNLSIAMGLGEIPLDKLHEKLSIKIKK
jgi:ATP-dependent RNA helicase MSS116, mitochondrial